MKVTRQEVEYVADLAHLELEEAEKQAMQNDLTAILDYIDQLSQLDTSSIEPLTQVAQLTSSQTNSSALRPDELRESLQRDVILKQAPLGTEEFFRVPKVIER